MKILILAEKQNAAKDIAAVFGISEKDEDGFFSGSFRGDEITVSYSNGHCMRIKTPEEIDKKFAKWNINDLPIRYPSGLAALTEIRNKKVLLAKLIRKIKNATFILNAGDAGREGELIQRWIIKKAGAEGKAQGRMWMQSLTKEAIFEAYRNKTTYIPCQEQVKRHSYDCDMDKIKFFNNLYAAGEARAVMDAFLGFNYSRALSLMKTDHLTVAYGRCQSPLVNAIVKRDIEIENFIKEGYSYVMITANKGDEEFESRLVREKDKKLEHVIFKGDKRTKEAQEVINNLADIVEVKLYEEKYKVQNPPKPYDILSLQKEMATKYKYEADETLDICQKLYDTYHILSYPRTDSRYLTTEIRPYLRDVARLFCFGKFKEMLLAGGALEIPDRYFSNDKVVDHYALVPVSEGNMTAEEYEKIYKRLSEKERNVFDAVATSFLSLFLLPREYNAVKVVLSSGGYDFMATGQTEINPGFSKFMNHEDTGKEKNGKAAKLPSLTQGENIQITKKSIKEDVTKPKKRYNTASLLELMKIHKIGTGATRDTILKEITEVKGSNKKAYVTRKGGNYISTDFGREVNSVIPDRLKSISYLSSLDGKLKEIEEGRRSKDLFISDMIDDFSKFLKEEKDRCGNDNLLKAKDFDKCEYKCPICGGNIIERDEFYGCENYKRSDEPCKFTLSKKQYGKTLTKKQISDLMTKGKTSSVVKGLKAKSGRKMDGYLLLKTEGGKARVFVEFAD